MSLLLHGGVDADGMRIDVRTDPATGRITAVGVLEPHVDDAVADCAGMVVLPAPAEPHAHLDKALSAGVAPNPKGDLLGAIDAWHAHRVHLDEEEILGRARAAVHELVAHGATAVRSHADVGPGIELTAVRALVRLRQEVEGLVELQVVALAGIPLSEEPVQRLLRAAMEAGADVVGGCPHLDPDPEAAAAFAVGLARELGTPLDLHTDEQLDPSVRGLAHLAALTTGFPHGATASHCVSLGVQEPAEQDAVAEQVAAAGLAVVACPQTNLYLQARGARTAPARGLTAVRALMDAGATIAAGADNARDPFNAMGRCDPLETAALLVMAAHLTPHEAYERVSGAARAALGLEAVALREGAPAELLAVRGASLPDAMARASEHRHVVHRGRLVASTTVQSQLHPIRKAVLT